MATDDTIRASDVDREAVVATLREAYTAGRLTLDEFDDRMAAAYAGKTWGDLRGLTADLPVQPVLGSDIPDHQPLDRQPLDRHAAAALPPRPLRPEPEPGQGARPPVGPSRRSPVAILIPIAVWTLLVVHGSVGPGVVFLLIAVFALASIMATIRRR
jgi:Domain of unknown function (DUF1707)